MIKFFNSDNFMPHGHCFFWQKNILWLHVISDAGIALAYYFIPLLLFYLIRKRKDLPYKILFSAFSAFILLCGTTHLFGIWVLWHPDYGLEGLIKALTAIVSISTLFILGKIIPKALLYIPENIKESAVQLKLLANSLPQLIWMADDKGWVYWYNERWYEYTGTTLEAMEGWGWTSVHDPEKLPLVIEKWKASVKTGEPFEMVFPLKGADGVFRSFLTRANPVLDSKGKIVHWFGTNTDITEQQHAAQAIKNSENRWRTLTEAMPQLVWIDRGTDRWYEYLSKQWQDYTNIPVEQLLGLEWLNALHPEDKERIEQIWLDSVSSGLEYDMEYRIRRYDGVYRWFKVRGVPSFNDQGKIDKWYGTCTDIQELVDARKKAEDANLAKTDFLANMSHEIRTPMNAVIGLSNILAFTKPLTSKQKEFITTLQLSAEALLTLINDLLDISKIEAYTVELEKIPFSIETLINEVISIMSVRAKEKNLSFTFDGKNLNHTTLIGDPARIRQIVMNLCSNAIKFTEHGEVHVSAECVASTDMPEVIQLCLKIQDSGIGIPKEKQEIIFHKFIQADASINRKYGGTGLGLAISKTLTEMMRGTIKLESEVGKGSIFTVCLPLAVSHPKLPLVAEISDNSPSDSETTKSLQTRVLLVEDNEPNILVAGSFLEQFGYAYEVAINGVQAVEKARTERFSVVLMDIQMQGMDGLEATRRIRELERAHDRKRLYIIGLTAYALAGDKERCLAAGMDDYIAKPFNPNVLQASLAAATGL